MNRSENMRRIQSRDTEPEIRLRRALYKLGLRYRCNRTSLPGKPDISFGPSRLAVFVHGCFWHQHPHCRRATTPKTNVAYWRPKLERNVERDKIARDRLHDLGYEVIVVWECQIRQDPEGAAKAIKAAVERRSAK